MSFGFVATYLVPLDGPAHGSNEYFNDFVLVGECETHRVGCKSWRLLGDIADKATGVWCVFQADCGVGVCDDGEWNVIVDVVAKWEVGVAGFDEGAACGHVGLMDNVVVFG